MKTKGLAFVALAAIGTVAAVYILNSLTSGKGAPATARGVTDTAKDGGVITTPIQLSKVAAVAIADPLDWLSHVVNKASDTITANLSNGSAAIDYRIPFGNPESAAAAGAAPKESVASNYRPSLWAGA